MKFFLSSAEDGGVAAIFQLIVVQQLLFVL